MNPPHVLVGTEIRLCTRTRPGFTGDLYWSHRAQVTCPHCQLLVVVADVNDIYTRAWAAMSPFRFDSGAVAFFKLLDEVLNTQGNQTP